MELNMNTNKKMTMILLLTFIFIFNISTVSIAQAGFQQDSGADGIVSMEAESFTNNVAGVGDYTAYSWVELSDAEASGGDYMVSSSDDGNKADETTDSPHLDFTVDFTKTGTHYVWVRAKTPSTSADSCYLGYNGSIFEKWGMGKSGDWTWKKWDDSFTATPGEQTFTIYMREPGARIDKIVLTVSSSYTPTG